jgi:hypothetical protein
MRSDIVPGAIFPDYELADHIAKRRMLDDLPKHCAVGTKRNAKGHTTSWIGYKLPLDVTDGDSPSAACSALPRCTTARRRSGWRRSRPAA